MTSVRKAILFSAGSQYLIKLIGFISVIVLARIMTPEELGIFAIASSVVMLATEFRLLGTTNYLIRQETVNKDLVCSGVGLTVIICWALGAAVFITAPYIGDFYQLPSLIEIFRILSASFFLAPFISVTSAILTREMKFAELMYINIAVQSLKLLVSIGLVLAGYSYYGLAWGVVIGTVLELIFLYYFKPEIVSWVPRFKGLKPIAKFGIFISFTNIMTRFETAAPDIIIGKVGTPVDVAIYSRGMGFLTFLNEIISAGIIQVALPHLSKVKREGGDLSAAYTKASLLLGSVMWPVLAVAGLASTPAILLMFGEQWTASIPIVSILTGWAIFKSIHSLSTNLLYSSGHESLLLIKQFIMFISTVIILLVSVNFGLETLSWSMVGIGLFESVLCTLVLKKAINLSAWRFIKSMMPNYYLVISCSIVAYFIDQFIHFELAPPILSLLLLATIMPITWLTTVWLIKHPIYFEILPIINAVFSRKKTS
ncbi:lipopolysaccharide biosynthesis protein [Paraglaciecola sp.]|uniref:lipopolysaccharide biosynthesis protein n=1 Tax=Paraglaciecola sp. TaxID=1920173 RepID=UPI00273D625F|nr:lipopolysaccharide biosynthesis protein [Paraglaciecola sp.]MDP5032327.1 lipopolysaccharide biosynthesis protein [Paraglaciecola sp.]